ncbi:MAG: AbrB/MazE/SpoVT family DNA-binding domain-containing protein [Balneola sp.]
MKTKIIKIGNSQGVRIPKPIIEQSGLDGEIELLLKKDKIILQAVEEPRVGWESSFKEMAKENDDNLLDENEIDTPSEWDDTEWTW